MSRKTIYTAAVLACFVGSTAFAQEGELVGAGAVEITAMPGGGTFFITANDGTEPEFDNYSIGGSITGNVNRWLGIEGDLSVALGRTQTLDFSTGPLNDQLSNRVAFQLDNKTPTMIGYNGSALLSPFGSDRRLAPYGAVGIGAMTMLNTDAVEPLGITSNRTFFTGNFGAGVKWFPVSHWGIRGDYRFFLIKDNDKAPEFFGQQGRSAHRLSGGFVYTY